MHRRKSFAEDNKKTLFLVATPIGNLEDITIRALETLKKSTVIYCEDKRNSIKLLNHYAIKVPLKSYHEFNKNEAALEILNDFLIHDNISLISDAGTPVISDPGYELVKRIVEANYNVVSIPGASAFLNALVTSTLAPKPFLYFGFLSEKEQKRRQELESLRYQTMTLIFYEAPHRLKKTLEALLEIFGSREIVIARELTKKFEEIIKGSIEELLIICDTLKGEMVLLVEGNKELPDFSGLDMNSQIDELISEGMTKNEAIKLVAKERGLPKQEVYKKYLNKGN